MNVARTIPISLGISKQKGTSVKPLRLSVRISLLKRRTWNRVKSLLILLVDVISVSFCTFVEVTPNLTGRRGEKWSYQMVQEYHPLCKSLIIMLTLEEFPEDKQVIVVSDVIDWCKKQPYLQGDRFHFSDASYEEFGDGASVPYVDLCLMTLCGGAIIANSSLSWWGCMVARRHRKGSCTRSLVWTCI